MGRPSTEPPGEALSRCLPAKHPASFQWEVNGPREVQVPSSATTPSAHCEPLRALPCSPATAAASGWGSAGRCGGPAGIPSRSPRPVPALGCCFAPRLRTSQRPPLAPPGPASVWGGSAGVQPGFSRGPAGVPPGSRRGPAGVLPGSRRGSAEVPPGSRGDPAGIPRRSRGGPAGVPPGSRRGSTRVPPGISHAGPMLVPPSSAVPDQSPEGPQRDPGRVRALCVSLHTSNY